METADLPHVALPPIYEPRVAPVAVVHAVLVSSPGACLCPAEIVLAIGYRVPSGEGASAGGAKWS